MTNASRSTLEAVSTYAVAGLIGIVFFCLIYPNSLTFLAGNGVYFEIGDAPQHVSGWLLYAKDSWRWPLLTNQLIAPPQGSSLVLTDSIPLAALIFKPLFPYLWENFHYFGIWHLFTKVFQAVGAVFLIRSLGQRTLFAGLAASVLALLWPAMLDRLHHTALMTHGLLLFALGFYFRSSLQSWSARGICLAFAVLLTASLLIHPYLFAMAFALFLATAWDRWNFPAHWLTLIRTLASVSFVVVVLALLLGYGSATSAGGGDGYGVFSMNLLSPFCGGTLSPCISPDATGGQYEGFNYFGLGVLLVLTVGTIETIRQRSAVGIWLKTHPGLVFVLMGLTLYAVSNHVYLGTVQLVSVNVPFPLDILTSVFRASGRFFWPVGYAVFFLALAAVLRLNNIVMIPVICLAILLQWQDTDRLRAYVADLLTSPPPFDYSGWSGLQGNLKRIEISPDYGCDLQIANMHYVYFQIVAGRLGVPINTAYQARSASQCQILRNPPDALTPGTLHVDLRPTPEELKALQSRFNEGTCWQWNDWGGLVLCLEGSTREHWGKLEAVKEDDATQRPSKAAFGGS